MAVCVWSRSAWTACAARRALCCGARLAQCALALGLCGAASCEWPRDPAGTLERVRGGELRVGACDNPPWAARPEGPSPSRLGGGVSSSAAGADGGDGVEVELVRRLAVQLGARLSWSWGGAEEQLLALQHFELDLVIGGLAADTPWRGRVALTRPYWTERTLVGTRPSAARPGLRGLRVQVERGRPTAAWLARAGALPLRVSALDPAGGPLAAPHWQLAAWGLVPLGESLHESQHVWALPRGENAWLMELERFLKGQGGAVERLLLRRARLLLREARAQ